MKILISSNPYNKRIKDNNKWQQHTKIKTQIIKPTEVTILVNKRICTISLNRCNKDNNIINNSSSSNCNNSKDTKINNIIPIKVMLTKITKGPISSEQLIFYRHNLIIIIYIYTNNTL